MKTSIGSMIAACQVVGTTGLAVAGSQPFCCTPARTSAGLYTVTLVPPVGNAAATDVVIFVQSKTFAAATPTSMAYTAALSGGILVITVHASINGVVADSDFDIGVFRATQP